ncbi:hypothetical protein BU25DRAFT_463062 [Macroventuria anomochaeta]|uniref:Uncharacterized protein n=1 Tax=Macroventuria anomochaeta TaxID=301207 RepID=A0ACB6RLW5_9PLEO|nr:uncharacterized protein BU25DRAFT_463062 [Macroventuria anomochaeta]KAF2622317.1 hypothetical protein BU25DRAFT_463062 [Macroventuria anomochaeta]
MELAHILSTRQPRSTIILGAFAGEEQNLYGSTFFANALRNASVNVEGMLSCDLVGSLTGDSGQKDPFTIRAFAQGPAPSENTTVAVRRLQIGGENDSPTWELAERRHHLPSRPLALSLQLDLRTENGTVYGDLIEFVDFDFTTRVGKVNLATLWSMSEAPRWPRNATVDTTVLDKDGG